MCAGSGVLSLGTEGERTDGRKSRWAVKASEER